jgi:hypothetical protein
LIIAKPVTGVTGFAIYIGYDRNLVKVMMELGKYYDLNLVSRLYHTMKPWEYSFNVAKSFDE